MRILSLFGIVSSFVSYAESYQTITTANELFDYLCISLKNDAP